MNELNDVAIAMAKRIEGALVGAFLPDTRLDREEQGASYKPPLMPPSFYNLRRTILDALSELIEVYHYENIESDYMIDRMTESQRVDYREHVKRKMAVELAEKMINDSEVVSTFDYASDDGGWSHYRSQELSFAVLKLGKIEKEERN